MEGSVLSPLLFLLLINDVRSLFQYSETSLFADDLKVVYSLSSPFKENDISAATLEDTHKLYEWTVS